MPKKRNYRKAPRKEFHQKLFKNPPEVVLALVLSAVKKGHNHFTKVFLLGLMGGVWIGMAGSFSIAAAGGWAPSIRAVAPALPKLMIACTFPIGLILILVVGGELFTGNVMVMTLGALTRKITPLEFIRTWGLSYVGNWAGATLMALVYYYSGVFSDDPWHTWLASYTHGKIYVPWGENVLRGVVCNIVVCAAVCLCTAAEDVSGKILGVYSVVAIFVLAGYEHCVANMFFLTAGVFGGSPTPELVSTYGDFIWRNLIPVTLGNILGPALFLAPILWYNFYVTDDEIRALNFKGHGHKPHPEDIGKKRELVDQDYKLKDRKNNGKSSPKDEHVTVDISAQTSKYQRSGEESKQSDTDPEVASEHSTQQTHRKTSLDKSESEE